MKLLKRLLFIPSFILFIVFGVIISIIAAIFWILTGKSDIFEWYDNIGDKKMIKFT